jgi:hypothetical protein
MGRGEEPAVTLGGEALASTEAHAVAAAAIVLILKPIVIDREDDEFR